MLDENESYFIKEDRIVPALPYLSEPLVILFWEQPTIFHSRSLVSGFGFIFSSRRAADENSSPTQPDIAFICY